MIFEDHLITTYLSNATQTMVSEDMNAAIHGKVLIKLEFQNNNFIRIYVLKNIIFTYN